MDSNKPSLWCVFGNNSFLDLSRGDHIGENRIVRLLTKIFNVYYNGYLVKENDSLIGGEKPVSIPERNYDLYYVRNNAHLFSNLPSPKMYMGYPYEPEALDQADAVVVTTEVWKNVLKRDFTYKKEELFFEKHYPANFNLKIPIIQIKQYVDPLMSTDVNQNLKQEIRNLKYLFTNSHSSFGFFGRLASDSLPYYAMEAIKNYSSNEDFQRSITIFGGKIRNSLVSQNFLPMPSIYVGEIPYSKMPTYLRAVNCTLAGEGVDDFVLGSNKVLDSIGQGVPVLSIRNGVRTEYLGESYPLLLNGSPEDEFIIRDFLENPSSSEFQAITKSIIEENTIAKAANHLKIQINAIFNWEL